MWIDNRIARPLKEGYYKTLVTQDEWGTLKEYQRDYYNGLEWDWCMSNAQFIGFWWATNEECNEIFDKLENERN
jgi:hypothetical protein